MSIHSPLHARLGCESQSWDSWRIFLSVFFLCVGIRDGIMFAWRGEGGGIIYIRDFMVERGWFWRVGGLYIVLEFGVCALEPSGR